MIPHSLDPLHSDDDLDNLRKAATETFAELGGDPEMIDLAVELEELGITSVKQD